MNNSTAYLTFIFLPMALISCATTPATHWVHPNKTQQQYHQDIGECLTKGSRINIPTATYNQGNPQGGFAAGVNSGMANASSMNAAYSARLRRTQIEQHCMLAKGWRQQPIK